MYLLSKEQEKLRSEVHEFVDSEVVPVALKLTESKVFPSELFSKIGQLGYLDAEFSYIGTGAKYDTTEGTIIIEELSRGLGSLGLVISPHYQCTELIATAGSERLKKDLISPARKGEILFAFAISEESGGSDAVGIKTIAAKDKDRYIISGKKCWITNASVADGYIITAKTPTSGRSKSVSIFYIDKNTPGLTVTRNNNMLGLNNSPMGDIIMDECSIPEDCLIGELDRSYPLIKPLLNEGRLDMAAVAVGISQSALEAAVKKANEENSFGQRLSSYQSISFSISEMYTKIMVARNSLYSVASLMASGMSYTRDVAALKLFATESCCEICKKACQIHGASGLSSQSSVDRMFRDANMLTIAEGTSEICKIVISNGFLNAY